MEIVHPSEHIYTALTAYTLTEKECENDFKASGISVKARMQDATRQIKNKVLIETMSVFNFKRGL